MDKLRESVRLAYQQGSFVEAIFLVEDGLQRFPHDIWLHSLLGELLKQVVQSENPSLILFSVVQKNKNAYSSRLIRARLLESDSNYEMAFKEYLSALKSANQLGFWLDNNSTPHWCREYVIHAVSYIEKYRKEIINLWIEDLCCKYGESDLDRVIRGIRMYSGDLPLNISDDRQKPSFFYVPDLPVRPVFKRKEITFSDYYEDQYHSILDELNTILEEKRDIPAYVGDDEGGALTSGGGWDALFFFRHGKKYDENHLLCPSTSSVLTKLPLVHILEHSPEVCFSVLRPNTHILPHRGVTNSRCVLHMGLKVPENCKLNICGIQEVEWNPGKIFMFDDTYLHEAWNKSEQSRYVLLTDVWNPFLSEAETAAITDFVVNVGELNTLR